MSYGPKPIPAPPGATQTPTFADADGREWEVRLRFASFAAARALGLKAAVTDGGGFAALLMETDPTTKCQFLWAIVRAAAEAKSISQDAFFDALDGPAIYRGTVAVMLAAAAFHPANGLARSILTDMPAQLAKFDAVVISAMDAALAKLPDAPDSPDAAAA